MPIFPELTSSEAMTSKIQNIGNYFIMDTEQLVSNPFAELRTEAQGDFLQKRTSQMEKMTTVRNNVCENHFRLTEDELERKKNKVVQRIHSNTSKYRFEIKLLELDRRKHDIETRKRIEPNKNYDYDDTQIMTSSKRLGANISTPYLEKRLKYPVRVRSVTDLSVSPTVAKARQSLKQHKMERESHCRSMTAKSLSSVTSIVRSARSAPTLPSKVYKHSDDQSTRFPSITKDETNARSRHKHFSTRSSSLHVKFASERARSARINRLERTAEILNLNPGDPAKILLQGDLSDSEDDFAEYERIDLRAILFGEERQPENVHPGEPCSSARSQNISIGADTSQRATVPIPKVTPELLHQQFEVVQKKIGSFLKDLDTPRRRHRRGSSSDEEEEFVEAQGRGLGAGNRPGDSVGGLGKHTGGGGGGIDESGQSFPEASATSRAETRNTKPATAPSKKAWEYIRGRSEKGGLSGTYSTQDLVLQRLTGVTMSRNKNACVPLNSAGRAMRKTPTFKMRQVIERLKANRNKYEEHEVNELKRLSEFESVILGGDWETDLGVEEGPAEGFGVPLEVGSVPGVGGVEDDE